MKIQFKKDYTVKCTPPEVHVAGEIYECNQNSAQHFINRGVAVLIKDDPVPEVIPVEVEKKTEQVTSGVSQPDPASPEKTVSKPRGRPRKSSR